MLRTVSSKLDFDHSSLVGFLFDSFNKCSDRIHVTSLPNKVDLNLLTLRKKKQRGLQIVSMQRIKKCTMQTLSCQNNRISSKGILKAND